MDELRPRDIRFDIIVPIHNMESIYVLKAIDSVLNQSHRKWRLTIVESRASFEKTKGKWRAYVTELDDSRFYHCVEHKKGISAARNQASKCERSEYIAFLDGDDSWMTHHLQTMAEAICLSTPDTGMWGSRWGRQKNRDRSAEGGGSLAEVWRKHGGSRAEARRKQIISARLIERRFSQRLIYKYYRYI